MFRTGKRLIILIGFSVIAALGLTACGGGPNALALVGSDTTFDVMNVLSNQFNGTPSADTAYNVPPVLTGSQTFNVGSDKRCGAQQYNSTSNPPPNGSSAGISALNADTLGCIDIARSSRDKRDTDPDNLQFFAYARDAVTWARWANACPGSDTGPAGCAPTDLSQDELKGIYLCDQPGGIPAFTNWNQVGGDNGGIVRYLPQAGSGTLSFFETKILGLSSAQQGHLDGDQCLFPPTRVQENAGNQVMSFKARAIFPYSFAQWTAQAGGVVPDIRGGALLGTIDGVAASDTTIANDTFLGVRYVNNVVKTGSPSFAAAVKFVGVDSGGPGFLCANTASVNNVIQQYGFVLNPVGPTGGGLPNSRCRLNPAPL